ncbi:MAG: cytochrome c oxidase subunit 3, partial [Phycisphaerales bacterium]
MSAIPAHPEPADAGGHDHGHGHDGHHGHSEYPFLAHHFETPAQQFDSGKLGMWLFLATEVLFFGGLFAAYAVLRFKNPEVFAYSANYLDTIMGGINTCVLIASSLTMALAVRFAQTDKIKPMIVCLVLTFMGAVGFMVIKYFEYTHKIHDHLVWGPTFYVPPDEEVAKDVNTPPAAEPAAAPTFESVALTEASPAAAMFALPPAESTVIAKAPTGPAGLADDLGTPTVAPAYPETAEKTAIKHLEDPKMPVGTHQFFAIYYAMTGLHGIHVVVGMIVIGWLIWKGLKGHFGSKYYTPVDLGGLYWHVVDLIWIFLFPLFYL